MEDFKNQKRIVLGSERPESNDLLETLYRKVFPTCHYIKTDAKTACFIKYFCNCFFAAKVSLMNEFHQVATEAGINWEDSLDGLLSSGWVNPMHTMVPGPDGHLGYGGKCFPKDVQAFNDYCRSLGLDPKIQKAAWEKNLEIREDRNWERISGAISKKKIKKDLTYPLIGDIIRVQVYRSNIMDHKLSNQAVGAIMMASSKNHC